MKKLILAGTLGAIALTASGTVRSYVSAGWSLVRQSTPTVVEIERVQALIEERSEKIAGAKVKIAESCRKLKATEAEIAEIDAETETLVGRVALLRDKLAAGSPSDTYFVVARKRYPRATLEKDAAVMVSEVRRLESRKEVLEEAAYTLRATVNDAEGKLAKAGDELRKLQGRADTAKVKLEQKAILEDLTGGAALPGIASGELEKAIGELERRVDGGSISRPVSPAATAIDFEGKSDQSAENSADLNAFLKERGMAEPAKPESNRRATPTRTTPATTYKMIRVVGSSCGGRY